MSSYIRELKPAGPLDCFHPVMASHALKHEPVRVTIASEHYVLFRGEGGAPAALVDRCPHRFASLSEGKVRSDGRLQCPYHGWHFDADGHGVSPSQPSLARCDVRALQVRERDGYLWLGRAGNEGALPKVQPEDPRFALAGTFSLTFEAALEHTLDIFSDAEHPAWVHGRLAWSAEQLDDIRYEHQRYDDRTEVQTSGAQRTTFMSRLLGLGPRDRFHNHWVTRFDPVRTHFHMFWTDAASGEKRPLELQIALFMVPEAERKTRLHGFVYTDVTGTLGRLPKWLLKRLTVSAAAREASEDQHFMRAMRDAPITEQGMRLGRLDGAIVHNRKLLKRLYLRESPLSVVTARSAK